ncbi:hypothetical protein SSIG_04263 [Streptomyces filamentosus NRRL 11379]|uniref:Predicted protein n=1 Tax=Streptomyces filamentosus NRRL 15998 TaxID=457431 RepID=D6ADK6_STRFL|nr:predicted protein [Streptomyces filamentosus NRRL 15998]EWS93663.1 hypothetical protein SSIG_04263 [Streptomyces filamentosus NRRL 11379]
MRCAACWAVRRPQRPAPRYWRVPPMRGSVTSGTGPPFDGVRLRPLGAGHTRPLRQDGARAHT